ncbi:MAG: Uma2 family endonuclease [Planctomycetota bacterium]
MATLPLPVPDITTYDVLGTPFELPSEDGIPLETDWHRLEISLFVELVTLAFKPREDFFVGGNMFIYFDPQKARNNQFRGPDIFFVRDSHLNPPRPYWATWDEGGKKPNVIVELTSPSTFSKDFGVKKDVYERDLQTNEYFIFDWPERRLWGWRLNESGRYQSIEPNEEGRMWSEQLGMSLGQWQGEYLGKTDVYLRLFDANGELIPNAMERTEAEALRADFEADRADAESRRADVESRRADAESRRAEAERQRADALEEEIRRLRH